MADVQIFKMDTELNSKCCNPDCCALKESFEKDNIGLVCTSCGTIQSTEADHFVAPVEAFISTGDDRSILTNDNVLSQTSLPRSIKYSQVSSKLSQESQPVSTKSGYVIGTSAQREAHRVLLYLSRRVGMNQIQQDETLRKFNCIMKNPKFFRTPCSRRRTLAAVAIYLTAIEQGIALTMGSLVGLCNSHSSDKSDFYSTYMTVLQILPELKPTRKMNYTDLIEATVELMKGFTDDAEKRKAMELSNRLLPFDWRHNGTECYAPVHGIVACAFLAWKSLNPLERRKTNLEKFCRNMAIPCWLMTTKRLVKLTKALVKIGQSAAGETIPCREVTKQNVHIYLEGILMFDETSKWNFTQEKEVPESETNERDEPVSYLELWRAQDEAETKDKKSDDEEIDDAEIESYICDDTEIKNRQEYWTQNGRL